MSNHGTSFLTVQLKCGFNTSKSTASTNHKLSEHVHRILVMIDDISVSVLLDGLL